MLPMWLLFLVGVVWCLGIFPRRRGTAWWHEKDRVKRYVVLPPWAARLLVPAYMGFNDRFRTNLPFLYNKYYVNHHPDRLSLLGLVDYCVAAVLCLWYGGAVTAFFWGEGSGGAMLPVSVAALMISCVVSLVLGTWDHAGVKLEVIGKKELARRKGTRQ